MRVELEGIRYWRHDLTGCLHATMGALLSFHGLDPVEVLGAGWGFDYHPGALRREEYFLPGESDSLLSGLAPYHPVSSRWHAPANAAAAWQQVRAAIAAGRPAAVAVDNFHLPFRPAFGDVHTKHLITVYGFDDEHDEVLVADSVPPRFCGPIGMDALALARDSANQVSHDRDMFFTDNPIGNRWLEIEVGPDMPAFDRDLVLRATAGNLARFGHLASSGGYAGLAGERAFLADMAVRLAAGRADAVDEVFVVAGPVLATTAMHAHWLARAAATFAEPALLEAARSVERVAHHWAAIRITVASDRGNLARAAASMRVRAAVLAQDHERALGLIHRATAFL